MHILVLPSWYPTKENPINGSFFAEQAEALARYGQRVSVIALCGDAPKGCFWEERRRGEVMEYVLHFRPLRFHLTYLRVTRSMAELFSSAFGKDRPDIIHVHSFRAIRYARFLSKAYRIPFVVTEHVSWFERGMLSERDKRAISRDYAAATAVIAVSRGLREQIQPLCRQNVQIVPNLVGERFFLSPLEKKVGEGFRFLSIGSLNKNKGMDAVIAAFAEVLKDHPAAFLTICGDGEERPALERQTAKLGIADKVAFTGQVSREECAEYLSGCGAFVLASRVETFGVVLAEAMASGRPIVMTRTGAWRELATDGTGLAVEVDNIPALATAMKSMIQQEDRYDPTVIREYCRSRFSEKAVCESLTKIYAEVLEKEKCRKSV